MQHFSRNVTTIATDPLDIDGHVADLRSEIQRIANMMPNPFLRSGFVTAMDNSVETWSRNLTAQSVRRPSVKATCPKDHIDTRTRATEEDPPNDGDVTKVNAAKAVVESHWKRPRIELWGSRYSSETENMFGKIYYTSRTFEEQASSSNDLGFSDYKYEFETSFTLHPAQWLIKCGLNFAIRAAISQSVRGWKHNLEVHRAVPDDSVIFDLCEQGNIDGVRTLLASGKASVRDTNSWGRTPLHVCEIFQLRRQNSALSFFMICHYHSHLPDKLHKLNSSSLQQKVIMWNCVSCCSVPEVIQEGVTFVTGSYSAVAIFHSKGVITDFPMQ